MTNRLACGAFALAIVAGLGAGTALAGEVELDFTDFEARLNAAAADAGVANFTAGEVTTIKNNIESKLDAAYAGFDLDFTTAPAGGAGTFTTLDLGAFSATPGELGVAAGIDYRNRTVADTASVFTNNFGFIFEGGDSRATQIDEISAALAGTAAHELGHNLGLRHYDAFGNVGTGVNGGGQNARVMATGSTGLDELGRETDRTFSDLSNVKLNFTAEVLDTPLSSTAEQLGPHATTATAQALSFSALAVGGGYGFAANVLGEIASGGEIDFYSFSGVAGSQVFGNVLSSGIDIAFQLGTIDSILQLIGPDGTTVLQTNDDIFYNAGGLNAGTVRTLDSLILNFVLPSTGTYYWKVAAFSSGDIGGYEFLTGTTDVVAVPLPPAGWMGLAGLAVLGLLRRRRQRLAA